jgi:hypothetical protein
VSEPQSSSWIPCLRFPNEPFFSPRHRAIRKLSYIEQKYHQGSSSSAPFFRLDLSARRAASPYLRRRQREAPDRLQSTRVLVTNPEQRKQLAAMDYPLILLPSAVLDRWVREPIGDATVAAPGSWQAAVDGILNLGRNSDACHRRLLSQI